MSDSTYTVQCSDGQRLDVLVLPAVGDRLGVAVLGHAMMVDRRSMDRPTGGGFASAVAGAGWEVHLVDLRGRGASGPTVADGGDWSYDDFIARDLPACVAAARARRPGEFVWLVGHSLAGHASIAAAGCGLYEEPPDGHVLLSVNMWLPGLEPDRARRWRKRASVAAFAMFRRLFGCFPARRLGMGPVDEAGRYVDDLVRAWRSDRWGSADGRLDYSASMPAVRGPILSVIGRGDALMAHPVGAKAWTDGFGPDRAEFWLVGRGEHDLRFDPDHMTLVTDDRARPLWQAITNWMRARADEEQ